MGRNEIKTKVKISAKNKSTLGEKMVSAIAATLSIQTQKIMGFDFFPFTALKNL